MKTFVFKIENGKSDFIDSKDKAAYRRLILLLESKGIKKFKIVVETLDDYGNLSESQLNLFMVLVSKISEFSGNDRGTVRTTLEKNLIGNKRVEDLNKSAFSDFIEKAIVFSNEFFDMNISFNPETNYIEIDKI